MSQKPTKPCPFAGCPNPAHAAQFCCPACYGALPRADRDSVFHIRRKEQRGELTPAHARQLEQAIVAADRRGQPDPAARHPLPERPMHVEECRSCGAKVVWAKHEATGKPAPIDAEPVEYGGNVILNDDGTYRLLKKGEPGPAGSKRHKNHYATCPQAKSWRKAKS